MPASAKIDAGVRLRVATLLRFASLYTVSRESDTGIKACPEIGSVGTGGGTADQVCATAYGDCCARGASSEASFFQHLIETDFFHDLLRD
jgi:hypothetical protein